MFRLCHRLLRPKHRHGGATSSRGGHSTSTASSHGGGSSSRGFHNGKPLPLVLRPLLDSSAAGSGSGGSTSNVSSRGAGDDIRRDLEGDGCVLLQGSTTECRRSIFTPHAIVGIRDVQQVAQYHEYIKLAIDNGSTHPFMHAYVIPGDDTSDAAVPLRGCDDDGEAGAGQRILAAVRDSYPLELHSSVGVCVAVSRWYGGVQLGAKRFQMIAAASHEVLKAAVPVAQSIIRTR